MIENNLVPEQINSYNSYLDGDKLIGVASDLDLPELKEKTSTVQGTGIGGEIESVSVGQYESIEQEIKFNLIYSGMVELLKVDSVVHLTHRAAQQLYNKDGGYTFKGLRVVEVGRIKSIKLGKLTKSGAMGTSVVLEVTALKVENGGEVLLDIDKLNGKDERAGVDRLREIRDLV